MAGADEPALQQTARHDKAQVIVIRRGRGEGLRHVDDIEISRTGGFTRSAPRHALSPGIKLQEKTVHAVAGQLVT